MNYTYIIEYDNSSHICNMNIGNKPNVYNKNNVGTNFFITYQQYKDEKIAWVTVHDILPYGSP